MIEVSATLFRTAAICASTEEVRSYLNGVRIEPHPKGGVLLIATDGHRMLVIHDASGRCKKAKTVSIERAGLNVVRQKWIEVPKLSVDDNGTATIGDRYKSATSVFVKGDYPDWRAVVPVQSWKNTPSSFGGHYLSDFGKIAGQLVGRDFAAVRILCGNSDCEPALVLFPAFPDAFGILMPMRADVGGGLPAWMHPVMGRGKSKKKKAKAGEARAA